MTNLIVDEFLKRRRYPSVCKSRKQWICDRCGVLIEKGHVYEHSYSQDMKKEIRLCTTCYAVITPLKEVFS